ncbi:hypothetical protein ACFOEE_11355 [Pseudoalteromonas fenneropenaei]|uniref:EpsG family protein n=1 Tax=Pseudoalteromonas fenneropenaei TaxID=1737459 RepID=A0ABV7CKF2_9GAMM
MLLGSYTEGDQYHYIKFYNALKNAELSSLLQLMKGYLNAGEPLSGFVLWLGANANIDKIIYISFLNSIFAVGLYLLCAKHDAKWYFILLLYFNFYIIVLFTGAERLKISILLLTYGLLIRNAIGNILSLSSCVAHFQSSIVIFSMLFEYCIKASLSIFKSLTFKGKDLAFIIISLIVGGALLTVFGKSIIGKISGYSELSRGIVELTQLISLCFLAFFVLKNRFEFYCYMLPVMLISFVVGSSRINILAFLIFSFFVLVQKKTNHPIVIALMSYFVFKGYLFIENIFVYGNGFYIK